METGEVALARGWQNFLVSSVMQRDRDREVGPRGCLMDVLTLDS